MYMKYDTHCFIIISAYIIVSIACSLPASARPDQSTRQTQTASLNTAIKCKDVYLASSRLSTDEVARLEEEVRKDPDNLLVHYKLYSYYINQAAKTTSYNAGLRRHLLWIVHRYPAENLIDWLIYFVPKDDDPETYQAIWNEWQLQISKFPKNAAILRHAAGFVQLSDPDASQRLLEAAIKIEPDNNQVLRQLGYNYCFQINGKTGRERKDLARKALDCFCKSLPKCDNLDIRLGTYETIVEMNFIIGDMGQCTTYATRVLKEAVPAPQNQKADRLYNANVMLGRVALRKNDVNKAVLSLHAALKSQSGSIRFLPSMSLVRELLEKGERQAAYDFLQELRPLWPEGKEDLNGWSEQINKGLIPDFGIFDRLKE